MNMAVCELNNIDKDLFDISKRCRTCLSISAENNVFSKQVEVGKENLSLAEIIANCASMQISEQDGLPQQICKICEDAAINSHRFRTQCEASHKYLLSIIQRMQAPKAVSISDIEFVEFGNIGFEETIKLMVEGDKSLSGTDEKYASDNIVGDDTNEETFSKETQSPFCEITLHNEDEYTVDRNKQKRPSNGENLKKRTCPDCNKVFQSRGNMIKHQKNHDAQPKTCPFCNFLPSSPNILANHMEETHPHLKTFACSICDKAFFKNRNLRLHMQIHSGVKKHTCEVCGLSFVLRGNLSVHRRVHTGERPYTCSVCGGGFTQQSSLRSHEAGHSDRREHVCQECGAAFGRVGALRNHQKRHSSTRPFECSICGKKFTFSSERKRHMLIHSGDKNHECEVCGRRFTRNSNLKVHRRIHTGETPHVCEMCGKGFIQAHCLRTHMNTHTHTA